MAYTAVCAGFWVAVVGCTLAACRALDAAVAFVSRCRSRRRHYLSHRYDEIASRHFDGTFGIKSRACPDCAVKVGDADLLLSRGPGDVDRRDIVIDPDVIPIDIEQADHQLLCLSSPYWHGNPIVVPLSDPGSASLAPLIPAVHTHRLHVCAVVPTTWPTARTQAPTS